MSTQTNIVSTTKSLSMPRILLHVEGLSLLAASIIIYANLGFGWGTFVLLLLAPDLPLALYALNKNLASVTYNLVHTIIFPILMAIFGYFTGNSLGIQLSLIWLAHIGMDHVFGYGFKYLGHMKETHFSRI
jgi:hypothetical protein